MPLALTGWELGLLLTAAVFIVLALIASMVVPRRYPEFPRSALGWFVAGCVVLFVAQMTAVVLLAEYGEEHAEAAETEPGGEETETGPGETTETETEPGETTETGTTETGTTETDPGPGVGGEGDPAAGKQIFLGQPACGSCHTLADAGTSGSIGPNLDESQPSFELTVDRVTNGQGAMPPFGDTLTQEQIDDVAAYVSTAAGG